MTPAISHISCHRRPLVCLRPLWHKHRISYDYSFITDSKSLIFSQGQCLYSSNKAQGVRHQTLTVQAQIPPPGFVPWTSSSVPGQFTYKFYTYGGIVTYIEGIRHVTTSSWIHMLGAKPTYTPSVSGVFQECQAHLHPLRNLASHLFLSIYLQFAV